MIDVHGRCIVSYRDLLYMYFGYVCDWSRIDKYMPHVGFLHCPSLRIGQCEGLDTWDGQGLNSHVFLFYINRT